jgi:N-acetylglutamate synthase-like GNAT family acetyltransferase
MTSIRGSPCLVIVVVIIILQLFNIVVQTQSYSIRPATERDVSLARKILFQEKMNPLSISTQTMLVAAKEIDDDSRSSRPTGKAANYSEDNNQDEVLGFGQIRPLNQEYSELASLFVFAEYRHQGIGRGLVKALLQRHQSNQEKSKVCLLTLKPTSGFYKSWGFQEATDDQRKKLPKAIQLEYMAGKALSTFLGNELVCMIQS